MIIIIIITLSSTAGNALSLFLSLSLTLYIDQESIVYHEDLSLLQGVSTLQLQHETRQLNAVHSVHIVSQRIKCEVLCCFWEGMCI